MGGKPSQGTPADRRLSVNKGKPPSGASFGGKKAAPFPKKK